MQVELDDKFKRNFQTILEYIAKDKLTASKNFKKELLKQIKNLPNFPYKYRKLFYFEDKNIRDIIFKGYTIVYEVVILTVQNVIMMAINYERSNADLEKKSIKLDFGEIVYLENDVKSDITVVLLHGFGADKDNWNRFSAELNNKFHLIIPDLAGHGESVLDKKLGYTIAHHSEILDTFLKAKKINKIHLIGNSMGGAIALQYSENHKNINSLTLIDSLGMIKTKSKLALQIEKSGKNPFLNVCTEEAFNALLHLGMEKPPYIPGIFIDTNRLLKMC